MKIVFLDSDTLGEDASLESIKALGDLEVFGSTSTAELVERSKNAEVIITNKVIINREHLEELKNLKLICVAATGMNNIDLEACKDKNIEVRNVKGYSTESVAQLTLAMALSLGSRLPEHGEFGATEWKDSKIFTTMKFPFGEFRNKKWGIIGLGAIGKRVAELARAFGCEVIYYSTSGRNRDQDFQRGDLSDVLACDIISVHCPLTERTKDLINSDNVNELKDDAILINVARGGIVNEKDITKKFKESNLRLGFDVASVEPIESKSPLLEIAGDYRFLLTPHIAWASKEARQRLVEGIAKNVLDVLS